MSSKATVPPHNEPLRTEDTIDGLNRPGFPGDSDGCPIPFNPRNQSVDSG